MCRTKYVQICHREVPRTDFAGCRLRAHAAALRADLVREVEARLLMHVAIEASQKPFHLLVPKSATVPTQQCQHFATAPGLRYGTSSAEEDYSTQMASCVITFRGELLAVEHTDDGLAALQPRSLGFLVPGTILSPQPDQYLHGQTLRRYSFVLPIHRRASHSESLMAEHGVVADLAAIISDSRKMLQCRNLDFLRCHAANLMQRAVPSNVGARQPRQCGSNLGRTKFRSDPLMRTPAPVTNSKQTRLVTWSSP